MPSIGPIELLIVLAIALVILGPKQLPAAGRSLGRSMREFKDGLAGSNDPPEPSLRGEVESEAEDAARPGRSRPGR